MIDALCVTKDWSQFLWSSSLPFFCSRKSVEAHIMDAKCKTCMGGRKQWRAFLRAPTALVHRHGRSNFPRTPLKHSQAREVTCKFIISYRTLPGLPPILGLHY
jgi:hypothetical protein